MGDEKRLITALAAGTIGILSALAFFFADVRVVAATALSNAVTGCFALLAPQGSKKTSVKNNEEVNIDEQD